MRELFSLTISLLLKECYFPAMVERTILFNKIFEVLSWLIKNIDEQDLPTKLREVYAVEPMGSSGHFYYIDINVATSWGNSIILQKYPQYLILVVSHSEDPRYKRMLDYHVDYYYLEEFLKEKFNEIVQEGEVDINDDLMHNYCYFKLPEGLAGVQQSDRDCYKYLLTEIILVQNKHADGKIPYAIN